jgi:hypothetical protein
MKYCQGPICHEYKTKDRIRGPKGDKHYQTRKRSSFYYGKDNFCSLNCQNDWFQRFGNQAIDHFGRLHEPKRQAASGAWYKDYTWRGGGNNQHYFINDLLGERIPITREEYNNTELTQPS